MVPLFGAVTIPCRWDGALCRRLASDESHMKKDYTSLVVLGLAWIRQLVLGMPNVRQPTHGRAKLAQLGLPCVDQRPAPHPSRPPTRQNSVDEKGIMKPQDQRRTPADRAIRSALPMLHLIRLPSDQALRGGGAPKTASPALDHRADAGSEFSPQAVQSPSSCEARQRSLVDGERDNADVAASSSRDLPRFWDEIQCVLPPSPDKAVYAVCYRYTCYFEHGKC